MRRPSLTAAFVLAALLASGQTSPGMFQPDAVRVLMLSGRNNHEWRLTTPFLRKLLEDTGRFDVRVVEEPAGMTSQTLAAYDVVVSDYNGPRWSAAAESALAAFVKSGKGLVVVHAASYAFGEMQILGDRHQRTGIFEPPWPQWGEMVGATWSEKEPRTGHGKRHIFEVKFVGREHPIARGMKESFPISDELYHNFRMKPSAKILASAFDDPKMGGTGKEEPLLWTVSYGKGRVFHTALGHDLSAMQSPGFITTLARGTEWAAAGKVTLPVEISYWRTKQDAVRTQVVTGGHDFHPSFYRLFEGYDDISANVDFQPSAYRRDFRASTDVLVLYDMMQEITQAQKDNLTAFLESGKGLVILHHAVADYQAWPWWYQEVAGGRYLLKPDGSSPGSTYKHDEELFVEPVLEHPITSGMGPFHIVDETYKGMWLSPEIKVLLRTDNPTSDGPVAWIGPYAKSRVAVIQLGHDRLAHEHPAYRRLVRNAILWTAGRLR